MKDKNTHDLGNQGNPTHFGFPIVIHDQVAPKSNLALLKVLFRMFRHWTHC